MAQEHIHRETAASRPSPGCELSPDPRALAASVSRRMAVDNLTAAKTRQGVGVG
jgi:hypothetical protein